MSLLGLIVACTHPFDTALCFVLCALCTEVSERLYKPQTFSLFPLQRVDPAEVMQSRSTVHGRPWAGRGYLPSRLLRLSLRAR